MNRKRIASKLDPYREDLVQWSEVDRLTLAQCLEKLVATHGVKTSSGRLSEYLANCRNEDLTESILRDTATGARFCRALRERYEKDPPPDFDLLDRMMQTIIMELNVRGKVDPKLYGIATLLYGRLMERQKVIGGDRDRELDREKLDFLKRKYDESQVVETDSGLSEAEKAERIRAIFKR